MTDKYDVGDIVLVSGHKGMIRHITRDRHRGITYGVRFKKNIGEYELSSALFEKKVEDEDQISTARAQIIIGWGDFYG